WCLLLDDVVEGVGEAAHGGIASYRLVHRGGIAPGASHADLHQAGSRRPVTASASPETHPSSNDPPSRAGLAPSDRAHIRAPTEAPTARVTRIGRGSSTRRERPQPIRPPKAMATRAAARSISFCPGRQSRRLPA